MKKHLFLFQFYTIILDLFTIGYIPIVSFFRSNLAAIFGLQTKPTDSCSVKRTPPKKSVTQYNIQHKTAASLRTEVLTAKAVHAFKL